MTGGRGGYFQWVLRPPAEAPSGTLAFPESFLWGVASAAHQVEGSNTNNDWWAWEHNLESGLSASSGDACDSFHRWDEDVDLVAGLGLRAYRFSLEWSRIEPAQDEWSVASLDHYRRICARCHEHGILPVVTFTHFTTPQWLARRGAWEAADAPERFARYVERAAAHLGDMVGRACTINEPNVVAALGYYAGTYPPGVKGDLGRHLAVNEVLVCAHRLAVDALRSGPGSFPVGLTLSMEEMVADPDGQEVRDLAEAILENAFLDATTDDDFVGVQAYERRVFGPVGPLEPGPGTRLTQTGFEFRPEVVEYAVRRAFQHTGLPVMVTESGIATARDEERIKYLTGALQGVHRCLDDGIDVQGYFVWSLLDSYEWTRGYNSTYGLFAVDRTTFERRAKPSAAWYGSVAGAGALTVTP
ncbi:MAG: glycoside hydrolase family 1 protein [Acidimicrobiales bacterium]